MLQEFQKHNVLIFHEGSHAPLLRPESFLMITIMTNYPYKNSENVFIFGEWQQRVEINWAQLSPLASSSDAPLLCSPATLKHTSPAVTPWQKNLTKLYSSGPFCVLLGQKHKNISALQPCLHGGQKYSEFVEESNLEKNLCGNAHESFWGARLSNHVLRPTAVSVTSAPHQKNCLNILTLFCIFLPYKRPSIAVGGLEEDD